MIYAIEAVRRDPAGHITHVRWHEVDVIGEDIRHGDSVVVPVTVAMSEVSRSAVHVCHRGAPGCKVNVGQVRDRVSLVDFPSTPPEQRLQEMPVF
ncbi:hypothetical protein [Xylophilus sp. GOD-11R]|uniref:hypothetical protein n=1 Tax=Xylophilus sp. GOD-11R TaxID=3089814 RepID=UPI00298CADE9|nr:hypothetical protein [Xylophilus sp. GOD-11R]WPB58353.1 hypothetical protein R9X41_06835 [Xylophilus sp. GOD-11R]